MALPTTLATPIGGQPTTKRPTLNDIARDLGISRATVSNAFNHPELVAAPMLERILAHANAVGYYGPDPMARALRRKDLHEVAVVFHHDLRYALNDAQSVQFLRGVASALDKRQLALQLIPKMGRRSLMPAAFQTTADAIIVHAIITQELMPQVKAMRKPLVLVDTFVEGVACVGINDEQGAFEAMQHVLGHRPEHIVGVCLPVGKAEWTRIFQDPIGFHSGFVGGARLSGYLRALLQAHYPLDQVTWLEVNDSEPENAATDVVRALKPLKNPRQVGMVCMSDRIALAVMQALKNHGLPMPLSLVGFDGIPEAESAGLTTVYQDSYRKGEEAVRAVLDSAGSILLPVELVQRNT
jgi:DNA-binding LacI/PurR family transcriptional regulator